MSAGTQRAVMGSGECSPSLNHNITSVGHEGCSVCTRGTGQCVLGSGSGSETGLCLKAAPVWTPPCSLPETQHSNTSNTRVMGRQQTRRTLSPDTARLCRPLISLLFRGSRRKIALKSAKRDDCSEENAASTHFPGVQKH